MVSISQGYLWWGFLCMERSPAGNVVTYSPAYTLVPTYECFNRCAYCNFRTDPGGDHWLTLAEARRRLTGIYENGVREILILSGEVAPRSPRRGAWLQLIYELAQLALEMGFVPHTNAGPLSWSEMELLQTVNGSMGLMVEQLRDLAVHRHAPSKKPALRLQQLEWAGQLGIPFTTGLLLGIGESRQDWIDSLRAIAALHKQYGHIQEVILQPHSPGQQQDLAGERFDPGQLPAAIALSREILPDDIQIQIPPNLVADKDWLLTCINAGARDFGGIVPRDEVNPDYEHLALPQLASWLQQSGWNLQPRFAVYPQYYDWLPDRVRQVMRNEKLIT